MPPMFLSKNDDGLDRQLPASFFAPSSHLPIQPHVPPVSTTTTSSGIESYDGPNIQQGRDMMSTRRTEPSRSPGLNDTSQSRTRSKRQLPLHQPTSDSLDCPNIVPGWGGGPCGWGHVGRLTRDYHSWRESLVCICFVPLICFCFLFCSIGLFCSIDLFH